MSSKILDFQRFRAGKPWTSMPTIRKHRGRQSSGNRRSALVSESRLIISRNQPKSTISGSPKSVSVTSNIDLIGRCRVLARTVWRLFLIIGTMDQLCKSFYGLTRLAQSTEVSGSPLLAYRQQTLQSQNPLRRVGPLFGKATKSRDNFIHKMQLLEKLDPVNCTKIFRKCHRAPNA